MKVDKISTPEKMKQLKEELNEHHSTDSFSVCKSMGEILSNQMDIMLHGK